MSVVVSARPKLIKGCTKIAEYLGISRMQVYRAMKRGTLPGCFKIGEEHFCDPDLVAKETAELREAERTRACPAMGPGA